MNGGVKYEFVRQKLDLLGYSQQPLPISAIPVISTILDDLITTTECLKSSKEEIENLLEEKRAWELGNEVYKCDNSKLLSEVTNRLNFKRTLIQYSCLQVNKLKLDLLNKERNVQIENAG